jgi:hypothetical protein
MRNLKAARFVAGLQAWYRLMLHVLPTRFRSDFGEEMAEVFDERLAEAGKQGIWAVLALAGREVGEMPVALLRLHAYKWQKKRRRVRQLFSPVPGQAVFDVPPVDDDGRFSYRGLFLEIAPFLLTASLILLLTYKPPAWLPSKWRDPMDAAGVWAGVLPLLVLLPGLAWGMPRWAFPYAGLVAGYTLWAFAGQRVAWLWGLMLVAVAFLGILAVLVDREEQPLPPFFRRLGASAALDWTRLSFGVFGAAPLVILAAFDDSRLNQQTPYLALALLFMPLMALAYGRCRRQDGQLVALLVGTTLLSIPALLEQLFWRGGLEGVGWLVTLWAGLVTLLLLPLLSVPVRWASLNMSPRGNNKE